MVANNDEIAREIKQFSIPTEVKGSIYVKYRVDDGFNIYKPDSKSGRLYRFGSNTDTIGAFPTWILLGYFKILEEGKNVKATASH